MDIDSDTLGIPDTENDARITMPSSEFSRIVRDIGQLCESVRIEVWKEGVRFARDDEGSNKKAQESSDGLVAFRQSLLFLITSLKGKAEKKSKTSNDDISHAGVSIEMNQHVTVTFGPKSNKLTKSFLGSF